MITIDKPIETEVNLDHLTPIAWKEVNRALVKKAISEFSHELLLEPKFLRKEKEWGHYVLASNTPGVTYEFKAKRRSLDHWHIDEKTLLKKQNGIPTVIDAIHFVLEFKDILGIPDDMLPTYLEEITSTLSGAAYKYHNKNITSSMLVQGSFQVIEHAMTEGHPCFVANNGRIGFNIEDYNKYAPEADNSFQLIWLAGHLSKATFTAVKGFEYKSLMQKELGVATIAKFNDVLESLGLDMESYVFIPVHPWQWHNKIAHVFAADIANQDLVFLGKGEDLYSAQQSIRTLYNKTNPGKLYTKTALSILNMGFMRGLSPYYMQSTPSITAWITELLEDDKYLQETGFMMLGEVATVGYRNFNYEVLGKTNAHNKMLSSLWRESPKSKIKANQEVMTMAAFLHMDKDGSSLLVELIKSSPFDTSVWLKKYLHCYLSPLLHCFYTYEMVFMPHGENLIMVMENHTPVKVLMKDITEEVIVFNPELDLPEKVKRLYTETSDKMKVLSIFTDVFDCFFRFMANVLAEHGRYPEELFWKLVADCIYTYQKEHPELEEKYIKYNLFESEFDRCCLNRLQLNNTKQMLDLADPIESLQFVGTLKNPIAEYSSKTVQVSAMSNI
ncbi:IucA/IucC family protein [Aquimarina sediminis]|uniref:IucA/IucC family protein n=1 Tax=Aquimarina sediminis TaxID=2070536 RepID=UPI000CA00DFF|nr:IucA/IucC family siderophore biosynthesis protein [Aquimarina sediminis]